MKAAVIEKAGGDFIIKNVDKPSPSENEVLIKVEACGICHSDNFVKEGGFPEFLNALKTVIPAQSRGAASAEDISSGMLAIASLGAVIYSA